MRDLGNDSRARRSLRQCELDQVQRVVMLRFAPMTSQPLAGTPLDALTVSRYAMRAQ